MRYPLFLPSRYGKSITIHESIHDTGNFGGGEREGENERGERGRGRENERGKEEGEKERAFFSISHSFSSVCRYPIRYSACQVDTRYRSDSCIVIHESSIAQPDSSFEIYIVLCSVRTRLISYIVIVWEGGPVLFYILVHHGQFAAEPGNYLPHPCHATDRFGHLNSPK